MQSFTNKDQKKKKKKKKIKKKQNKKQNNVFYFFLILGWLGFFILVFIYLFVEIRAFTLVVQKGLAFSTSESYFICFTTLLYNTLVVLFVLSSFFSFLIISFKII